MEDTPLATCSAGAENTVNTLALLLLGRRRVARTYELDPKNRYLALPRPESAT